MSLAERGRLSCAFFRRELVVAAAAVLLLGGCTVRPLYMAEPATPGGASAGMAATLSSISVRPVANRAAQQVRNNLVFLLSRGGAEPTNPAYYLTLSVGESVLATATTQISDVANVPTADTLTLTGIYTLVDAKTNKRVLSGKRAVMSSFDVPQQEYAAIRAQANAQTRAARELAELLHLAIAQDLAHPTTK
jgi:LPS-assembly lipoprotein